MKKSFVPYNEENPKPFLLLFQEDPGSGDSLDGLLIKRDISEELKGIIHKVPRSISCFCDIEKEH